MCDDVDWIHLAQESKLWQPPIIIVMNPEIPLKQLWETSSLLECLHAAQEGFCPAELSI